MTSPYYSIDQALYMHFLGVHICFQHFLAERQGEECFSQILVF